MSARSVKLLDKINNPGWRGEGKERGGGGRGGWGGGGGGRRRMGRGEGKEVPVDTCTSSSFVQILPVCQVRLD